MKKAISILLSLCIFLSAVSVYGITAFAETLSDSDYEYRVKADGSAKITAYTGSDFNVVIPESIDGHTVSEIAYGTFVATVKDTLTYSYVDCIRKITIPKTVTKIAPGSFVTLPLLKRIDVSGDNPSFCSEKGVLFNRNKTKLICYPTSRMGKTYVIPETVKTIGPCAFSGSVFLQNVQIGKDVRTIKYCAFLDCFGIEAIYIPETVKAIESNALGVKTAYHSSYDDEFFDEDADPGDREWASSYEYFEEYYTLNNALTVYGESGSAAEKYCDRIVLDDEKESSVNFVALDKSRPKVKINGKKWTVTRYEGLEYYYYNVKIYKGKKLIKKTKLYVTPESLKNGRSLKNDFGLKKGTYSMKVEGKLDFAGKTVKTKWSKKVKFTVK